MAQLLFNQSYSIIGCENSLENTINYIVENDLLNDYYIIVPTNKSAKYIKNSLVRKYFAKYEKPLKEPNILNLEAFVKYILKTLPDFNEYQMISGSYQMAVFEKAVKKCNLNYFKKISDNLLGELFQMIFGIREDSTEFYSKKNGNSELESAKLIDLKEIYVAYDNALKADNLLDTPAIVNTVNKFLMLYSAQNPGSYLDEIFPKNVKILSFGFSEFKAPEFEFISKFGLSTVPFAMNIDYSTKNGPIFGNLYESIQKMVFDYKFTSFDLVNDEELISNENPFPKDLLKSTFLRRWLFAGDIIEKSSAFDDNIFVYRCEDLKSEINFVAKKIKELVKSGVKYSEISVCFRQPENYSGRVRDIFNQHRIPAFVSDRYYLSNSNLIAAIFSLIDIVINNFQKIDLQKALNSRFIKLPADENGEEINADNLINLAIAERISDNTYGRGMSIWENTIDRRIKTIEESMNLLDSDSTDFYIKTKELQRVKKAKRDLKLIIKSLDFENKLYTINELEHLLKEKIIKKFKIREQIAEFNKSIDTKSLENDFERLTIKENLEKDAKALIAFLDVINEMVEVEEKINPGQSIKLSEFISKLKITVSAKKYNVKEKDNFGVWVTATEQIRSIPYKYTFLCGLIDGEFPLAYNPRKAFGIDLPDTKLRHEESDRMTFYQFLTNNPDELNFGKKEIYLTFPKNSSNELLVRSQFIDALLRKTTIEIQDIPEKYRYSITSNFEVSKYYNKLDKAELAKYLPDMIKKEYSFTDNRFDETNPNLETDNQIIHQELLNHINKSISPSALEEYASCNYKHLLNGVLRIQEATKEEEEVGNKDIGTLLHEILFRFFVELRNTDLVVNSYSPAKFEEFKSIILIDSNLEQYQQLLIKLAEEIVEQKFITGVNKKELLNQLIGLNYKTDKKHKGLLIKWLNSEIEYSKTNDYYPAYFELGFGEKSKIASYEAKLTGSKGRSFKIKGKIDRVDVKFDENSEMTYKVIDYKTSAYKDFKLKEVIEGKLFQLPIYSLAFNQLMLEKFGYHSSPQELSYFFLKAKKDKYTKDMFSDLAKDIIKINEERKKSGLDPYPADQFDTKDKVLYHNLDLALNNIENMKSGYFNAVPDKDACKYCNFKNICRIEEK